MFTASVGFVAALAWNDAVQTLFDKLYPLENEGVIVRFIYAIIITVMAVILTTIFAGFIKINKIDGLIKFFSKFN